MSNSSKENILLILIFKNIELLRYVIAIKIQKKTLICVKISCNVQKNIVFFTLKRTKNMLKRVQIPCH